jgi:hypothetical protein
MADPKEQNYGGLAGAADITKINPYGVDDARLTELRDAQQKSIEALQNRYAQPNWFKVAAGFAKPQLGGFLASLGSASEALGESIEQQRAQQLPISQMKIQMAQQNILLGNKQKAASIVAQAQREGRPLTKRELTEVSNLDADRGKMIMEGQAAELQQKTAFQKDQDLMLQSIAASRAANIPLTPQQTSFLTNYKYLGHAPQVETSNQAPGSKPPVESSGNMHVINGVRMNDDVYNLHKEGIPITSNMRTQSDQDAIPRDKNNPNLTAEGRTIAPKVGLHGTGQAIDVGDLTDDQKQKLISQGWVQSTDPNDLNHWEKRGTSRTSAKPEEPISPPKVETSANEPPKTEGKYFPHAVPKPVTQGQGGPDVESAMASYKANIAAVETPIAAKYASQASLFAGNPPEFTTVKNSYNHAISLINEHPNIAQKVFSLVRNEGPLAAALNSGIGINTGSLVANIHLDLKAIGMAKLQPHEQAYADKLFSSLVQIAMGQMKESGLNMNNIPQGEFMKTLSQYVTPETNALTALAKLSEEKEKFDHRKEFFDVLTRERSKRVDPNSPTPYADVVNNSDEIKKLDLKYQARLRFIQKSFSKKIEEEALRAQQQSGG